MQRGFAFCCEMFDNSKFDKAQMISTKAIPIKKNQHVQKRRNVYKEINLHSKQRVYREMFDNSNFDKAQIKKSLLKVF